MNARGKWQGMWTIARLNWPFYAIAALVFFGALFGIIVLDRFEWKAFCLLALAVTFYFLAGSLGVSHLIYDRSDLYRWRWLGRALKGTNGGPMVFCHSGFDEISALLKTRLQPDQWTVLDHFDEILMTEPSIRRARKIYPPVSGTLAAPFDDWPLPTGSGEIVFGMLAIHELRSETERAAWFAEAKRWLRPGGRVILVEHTRDLANFLAFGPGFLHFHSPESWHRCWEKTGLHAIDEFRITPWIRVFVILSP